MMWPLAAETTSRVAWELARQQQFTERWHYLALAAAVLAAVAFVVCMYRRDSVELRPIARYVLLGLRLVALLGVLAYYLDLQKRTQVKVVRNSRALVLVDTSTSMGLADSESSVPSGGSRLDQVVGVLGKSGFLTQLSQRHDVVLAKFDAELGRIAVLPKTGGKPAVAGAAAAASPVPAKKPAASPADWQDRLAARGVETRLAQAIRQFIHEERGSPLSGMIIFTDGSQNAGIEPVAAIEAAVEAKVPLYPVGVGSARRPANVKVVELVAPSRAYPGDSFSITGYLRAQELADRTVTVELSSKPASGGGESRLEGTERAALVDGDVVAVKFEITPSESGRRTYRLAVNAPSQDSDQTDNHQEADVEVVDRQTRVLLIAGGPARDFIYLRNQLRRDKNMIVDVWLQSAQPGSSQDANEILEEFPSSARDLFQYDALIAFDPDWEALSSEQVDLLERWVGENAGGLLVTAGPVCTREWVGKPELAKVQALYPVDFHRRLTEFDDSQYGAETPWPIDFTREGLEAEFLWLADDAAKSQQAWAGFPGVFGYFDVRGAKPSATVYGRFSDPQAQSGDQQPAYIAGQFYGSGRVLYLGSAEMWRLRSVDEGYFEQIYTKLIRHVSQGRMLVGSSRGMLLVDRDRYSLGSTVAVRAQLTTAQFQPLEAESVPLQVSLPGGGASTLKLLADPTRKGQFAGQLTALAAGAYSLELAVPESNDERISRRFQVAVPQREQENPERNDALLADLARRTGGAYYIEPQRVLGAGGAPPLAEALRDRTEETYQPGVLDMDFQRNWMTTLLAVVCGALCFEWLLRRLMKLA